MITLQDVKNTLIKDLERHREDILSCENPSALMWHLVSEATPGNYNQLLAIMADNQDLSYIGYSHLVDHHELDVFQVIRAALSEPLSDLACDWINQAREEAEKLLAA